MADEREIDSDRYMSLKARGASAPQVYAQVREDGFTRGDGICTIRQLFSLSFGEAKEVVREINRPDDRSPWELAPVRSYKELEQVLRDELGYCGCADYEEAIEVLRDVLRCARDWQAALEDTSDLRRVEANEAMLERLNYRQAPGVATWFLYLLDQCNLIGHAGRITTCWIEPKGQQLLDAIEQWYPPPPDIKHDGSD